MEGDYMLVEDCILQEVVHKPEEVVRMPVGVGGMLVEEVVEVVGMPEEVARILVACNLQSEK
jgi:hypothetical protein